MWKDVTYNVWPVESQINLQNIQVGKCLELPRPWVRIPLEVEFSLWLCGTSLHRAYNYHFSISWYDLNNVERL